MFLCTCKLGGAKAKACRATLVRQIRRDRGPKQALLFRNYPLFSEYQAGAESRPTLMVWKGRVMSNMHFGNGGKNLTGFPHFGVLSWERRIWAFLCPTQPAVAVREASLRLPCVLCRGPLPLERCLTFWKGLRITPATELGVPRFAEVGRS